MHCRTLKEHLHFIADFVAKWDFYPTRDFEAHEELSELGKDILDIVLDPYTGYSWNFLQAHTPLGQKHMAILANSACFLVNTLTSVGVT